ELVARAAEEGDRLLRWALAARAVARRVVPGHLPAQAPRRDAGAARRARGRALAAPADELPHAPAPARAERRAVPDRQPLTDRAGVPRRLDLPVRRRRHPPRGVRGHRALPRLPRLPREPPRVPPHPAGGRGVGEYSAVWWVRSRSS